MSLAVVKTEISDDVGKVVNRVKAQFVCIHITGNVNITHASWLD